MTSRYYELFSDIMNTKHLGETRWAFEPERMTIRIKVAKPVTYALLLASPRHMYAYTLLAYNFTIIGCMVKRENRNKEARAPSLFFIAPRRQLFDREPTNRNMIPP